MYIKEILKLRFSNLNVKQNPLEGLLTSPGNQPRGSASAGDFGVSHSEKDCPVEPGVPTYSQEKNQLWP